jgi:hypothetical protein
VFQDWHQFVSEPPPERLAGLILWYPIDEWEPVRILPFSDLIVTIAGPGEMLVVPVLTDEAQSLQIKMEFRSARHLADALLLPLPMGACLDLASLLVVRLAAELRDGDSKHSLNRSLRRACFLEVEAETGEDELPGPAVRLSTMPTGYGYGLDDGGERAVIYRHEGIELLLPMSDGSPTVLAQRIRGLMPEFVGGGSRVLRSSSGQQPPIPPKWRQPAS